MTTVEDIYEQYRLMPGLQLHQLRVAAVAKQICSALDTKVDEKAVISAGLFHDMGNILKSDFTSFPDFLGDKDAVYWQEVKTDIARRYGSNVHAATMVMCREIGLAEKVIALIDGMGFSRMKATRDGDSMEQKIVEYADSRVAPRAVLSLHERLADARQRYQGKFDDNDIPSPSSEWMELAGAATEIENQIFAHTNIRPEDINDTSIAPIIEELKNYQAFA